MTTLKSITLSALLLLPIAGFAQSAFFTIHENQLHLVKSTERNNYLIEDRFKMVSVPKASSRTALAPAPGYLPGFVQLANLNFHHTYNDETNQKSNDQFVFKLETELQANRTLIDAFMVIQWKKNDQDIHLESIPLGTLKPGEPLPMKLRIFVNERYYLIDATVHVFSLGLEVGSSSDAIGTITPYQAYLETLEGQAAADGPIQPLEMVRLPRVELPEGSPPVTVKAKMTIDADGYVTTMDISSCPEWKFAKICQLYLPLFTFKPKIRDGEPVESKAEIPIRFN